MNESSILKTNTNLEEENFNKNISILIKKIRKVSYLMIKRLFDLCGAMIGLILLSPLFIIVVILIKLEDNGSAFFIQERIGKNGKIFKLYKFRSMHVSNNVLDFKNENKTTKVGKILRKTSLDELPQILNILKGEMSFIGPRPWIPEYYNNFTEKQKKRTEVLPGITGLAQAYGRNNLSVFDKIDYDITYVSNFSFLQDLKVVFQTIKTVLSKDGAEISKTGIRDEIEDLKFNYLHVTAPICIVNTDKYENKTTIINE